MMSFLCIPLLLAFSSLLPAASILSAHAHALPGSWYHQRDHPLHALFQRSGEIPTDGHYRPPVGSTAWRSAFPQVVPGQPVDTGTMPQSWIDFLETAERKGKIPDIPQTTLVDGVPTYPKGIDPNSPEVCSATQKICRIDGNYWDAPPGHVALSLDDGPTTGSPYLYQFLQSKRLKATHFFIGLNILSNPTIFLTAFDVLRDDIAVHTMTHPYLTTLTNKEIFAELAFTMKLIRDSSGGRLARFWRPPYGDMDKRVHAIANILGLKTVLWNRDTEDWSLSVNGTTQAEISSKMRNWLSGSKSTGLIILEHELTHETAQAFINNYDLIPNNGWKTVSVANMDGLNKPYQNAEGTTGPVKYSYVVNNTAST